MKASEYTSSTVTNLSVFDQLLSEYYPNYTHNLTEFTNVSAEVTLTCSTHNTKSDTYIRHLMSRAGGTFTPCEECRKVKKLQEVVDRHNATFKRLYDKPVDGVQYTVPAIKLEEHGNKLTTMKLVVHCPVHGDHNVQLIALNNNIPCIQCKGFVNYKSLTPSSLVEIFHKVYNNKYTYNIPPNLPMSSKQKIDGSCSEHGDFSIRTEDHLVGRGCRKCGLKRTGDAQRYTTEDFVKAAIKVHGDELYDYTDSVYVNARTKLNILCNRCHKVFSINPSKHINVGIGCQDCGTKHAQAFKGEKKLLGSYYIQLGNDIHGKGRYDYTDIPSDEKVSSNDKYHIKCMLCQHRFAVMIHTHMRAGTGCSRCAGSVAERKIQRYLTLHDIEFMSEYTIPAEDFPNRYRYDFYIPEHKLLIEYDGAFHYTQKYMTNTTGRTTEQLLTIHERDDFKTEYAKKNGYKLLRIPFMKFKELEEILNDELGIKRSSEISYRRIPNTDSSYYATDTGVVGTTIVDSVGTVKEFTPLSITMQNKKDMVVIMDDGVSLRRSVDMLVLSSFTPKPEIGGVEIVHFDGNNNNHDIFNMMWYVR